jgi:hypothetical protein
MMSNQYNVVEYYTMYFTTPLYVSFGQPTKECTIKPTCAAYTNHLNQYSASIVLSTYSTLYYIVLLTGIWPDTAFGGNTKKQTRKQHEAHQPTIQAFLKKP